MEWVPEQKIKEIKNTVPVKVGEKIRYYRRIKDYTQTNLADMIGNDRQYIYKIEKGKVNPSISTIALLAYALEIPLSKLLEDIEL
ncbi:helix-turn-helix domain-containing protein [Moheibacter sediminis]|uniref:DNA-binding transcriptional regulator, XRE-family HTH domain n=1 Tax=Moheibacter sediminis TaxID=1434700 RepID=A0A1W1YGQ7_9FLAO|nr:helix-turn-helix transcriptional regulator [Moheibacter sediminis]SMC35333.1 DNA-binding transcriptional regulator, XRE-family HTH domain [Moheibacter sediminis]